MSFTVAGGDERAEGDAQRSPAKQPASGVETLVSTPFKLLHVSLTPAERTAARIDDGMVRVSCGLEPSDMLLGDLFEALDATSS